MRVPRGHPETGLTLVEILISMTIFSIGGLAVAGSLAYSVRLNALNRETALVSQQARRILEELRSLPLEDVVRTYNSDPADDLDGYATASGDLFDLGVLASPEGGTGAAKAEVILPISDGKVLESTTISKLGAVGDLDGDGTVDGEDHLEDMKILPVVIRVRWRGATGDREFTLHTILR